LQVAELATRQGQLRHTECAYYVAGTLRVPSAATREPLQKRMMPFELFDPDGDLTIRQGNLPHWFQPGVTYFVVASPA